MSCITHNFTSYTRILPTPEPLAKKLASNKKQEVPRYSDSLVEVCPEGDCFDMQRKGSDLKRVDAEDFLKKTRLLKIAKIINLFKKKVYLHHRYCYILFSLPW